MGVPEEFTPKYLRAHTEGVPVEERLYERVVQSGEPYKSLYRPDFHASARQGFFHFPAKGATGGAAPGLDLEDDSLYYNAAGAAREYWSQFQLPAPTKDIRRLRQDLLQWGYCIIHEALSKEQHARLQKRIADQAAGERAAGVACWTGSAPPPGKKVCSTQFLHALMNKGEQFRQCVEHDPAGVQAGPLIEQLLTECLGPSFLMSSFLGIIANKHGLPQALHQDQGIAPFQDRAAPVTCNTMYILDDMGAQNGGTLVVPGSHLLISEAGTGNPVGPLPPAINLEAPAGSVCIFEGRLLHGTGVNRTDKSRTILVMNSVPSWYRQQEVHLLSADPSWLRTASQKLLQRIGAFAKVLGGVEGTWEGEYLVMQRLAIERGEYVRVGELSPDSSEEDLAKDYTYRHTDVGRRQAPYQPEAIPTVKERFREPKEILWHRPRPSKQTQVAAKL